MRRGMGGVRACLPLALGVVAAIATVPATTSVASAQVARWDPQTTNIPYLGWVGDEIRLNKCFVSDATSDTSLSGVSASFLVEDWSGAQTEPQVEPNTVNVYFSSTLGEVCAEGDVVSLFPGMSRIELDVADPGNVLGLSTDGGSPDPVLKHQFLAGWMTLNTPALTELAASDFTSSAQAEAALELGDPSGNGQFSAGAGSGYLDVKVTGSMPMDGPWAALVGESTVTLPNDWALLANALATDSNPLDADPAMTWDTSGDDTGLEGHVTPTPPCSPEPLEFVSLPTVPLGEDNVDDCNGGGADGPFSRVFGDLSGAGTSVGPFDPLDPGDTLLPDGALNALDAPMPPARIDVNIAPNSGAATDISGVGYLAPADKAKTYSRDFLGSETDSLPDDEYAPFYDEYIPATSRPGDASSGVDGGIANNFNGFLVDGRYHFWDFAATLGSNVATATNCLRFSAADDPQPDSPLTNPSDYYQTPSGADSVVVYTDQHGEAQVQWYPGEGFYFNSLTAGGAVTTNADGGCDLQGLYQLPGALGSATITATAMYPFKAVDYPPVTSAPVTKSVTSLWSKTLAYFPKGTGPANANSRIVVAHAQDIDGTDFAGEVVCFSADAEGVTWFDGTVGAISLAGTSPAPDPQGPSLGRTCVTTNDAGNAAVEVLESDPVTVDVIADFTNEGILRDLDVPYAAGSPQGGGTPPPAPSTVSTQSPTPASNPVSPSTDPTTATTPATTAATTGTSSPSAVVLETAAGVSSISKIATIHSAVKLVRLLTPLHGKRYVLIRVVSSARTVTVHLLLVNGRRATWKVVKIATNRQVKITLTGTVSRIKEVFLG